MTPRKSAVIDGNFTWVAVGCRSYCPDVWTVRRFGIGRVPGPGLIMEGRRGNFDVEVVIVAIRGCGEGLPELGPSDPSANYPSAFRSRLTPSAIPSGDAAIRTFTDNKGAWVQGAYSHRICDYRRPCLDFYVA